MTRQWQAIPYDTLGLFIRAANPYSSDPTAEIEVEEGVIVPSVSGWLRDRNQTNPKPIVNSDPEMLEHRRDCLFWQWHRYKASGEIDEAATRSDFLQVTKAFKVRLKYKIGERTVFADVVVGYVGGADD